MIERLRAWAQRHSERGRYTPVGIVFHWVMAALVVLQLGWGWYMSVVPAGGDKLHAFEVHSAIGLPILFLGVLRGVWRMIIPGPINDADIPGWQSRVAYATHYVFYFIFFALPISGWVMWSTVNAPGPLYLGGIMPWPQLPLHALAPETQWWVLDVAKDVHHVLIIVLVLLIPLHVGASLKHHFWDRHDVLRGMLPEVPDEQPPAAPPRDLQPG